jgi:ubiquinone/menaquinone biosynthesis C-methylase UbiE
VDISIERNQELIGKNPLKYIQGKAENMPFKEETFDKLYTIEAFQHFNVTKALSEFGRVLKKNGKLAISTFFVVDKQQLPEVLSLLPKPAILSDFGDETNAALPDFLNILKKFFKNIQTTPIGEYVWEGYNKWVHQREPGIWDKNWLIAYRKGLLDYYIITAGK